MPNDKALGTNETGKHTPGPWGRLDHDADGDFVIGSDLKPIIAITWQDHEDDEANARLIAAAPELLEALDAIVTSAHNGNEPGQTWIMVAGGLIDSADAAIRKAKGEQQ